MKGKGKRGEGSGREGKARKKYIGKKIYAGKCVEREKVKQKLRFRERRK